MLLGFKLWVWGLGNRASGFEVKSFLDVGSSEFGAKERLEPYTGCL